MRKHLGATTIAGFLVLMGSAAGATQPVTDPAAQAPVAVQRVAVPSRGLPDEATMVLVGAALIGLAAAVRVWRRAVRQTGEHALGSPARISG